jgi:hypothetical protein
MTMFAKELTYAGQTRRFVVSDDGISGWEVRIEQDSRIVRQSRYTDWHRVERALSAMSEQIGQLEREGWRQS